MHAIIQTAYGSPDVLQLKEVARPLVGDNEVLVRVHAASVNFGDKALMKGEPFLVRLMGYGLLKPKHAIPGGDLAGSVEAVGRNVMQFQPGDAVFGDIGGCGFGAFAAYVAAPEHALAPKPARSSFEQAAAVPQAGVVALQGLRDRGQLQPGQRVLIIGASGGVGTFAVQIARALGAEVDGVCSTRHIELVRSLGAAQVVDYTREDFAALDRRYDLIFDIVADRPLREYLRVLRPGGTYVACAFSPTALFLGPLISRAAGKQVRALVHKPDAQDLRFMGELLDAGKVVPVIDRCFPLRELAEAMRYLEAGGRQGKVVITLEERAGARSTW